MSQERPIRLYAGPWSLEFERWSGWIRCVRLNGIEVVRAVYAVVRDENWATGSQRVVHNHVSQEEGRFSANWKIELDELAYSWKGSLVCDGNDLQIVWEGESGQELLTRRTGVCVLHPQEIKGVSCEVRHTDGTTEQGAFPVLVEPHQPFFDIVSIKHSVGDAQFQIGFLGEVFEMEDQRNWTDCSFKTYCRPQEWAQPYSIANGDQLRHELRLSFEGKPEAVEPVCRTLITPSEQKIAMPKLGTVADGTPKGFGFALSPSQPQDWTNAGLGRIHSVGGFVELNRNRPLSADLDGVAFSATPQTHAFDERSIMENAHGLYDPVLTAKEFTDGGVVCVGPIAFQSKRQDRDIRIDEDIAPAWFLASLIVLAEAGADAACFLEQADFSGKLEKAKELIAGATEITVHHSDTPYRAVAFRVAEKDVLVNLRPYMTSVNFHEDIELEPYEIRVLEEKPLL